MSDYNLMTYTTQPGDNLWDLACDYGTTVEELLECNPGLDPNNLMAGQVIGIPESYAAEQWPPPPTAPWRGPWRQHPPAWYRPWGPPPWRDRWRWYRRRRPWRSWGPPPGRYY